LRQILFRLLGDKGMGRSLLQVLRKGTCGDEAHFLRLRSAGLIKGESRHQVQMRCRLYEDYLKEHL
jgi:hypothetical protein